MDKSIRRFFVVIFVGLVAIGPCLAQTGGRQFPDMVAVPAGSFRMGSTIDHPERNVDETAHFVSLPAFSIARTELTVGEFQAFVALTGYRTTGEITQECWYYSIDEWISNRQINWKNPGCPQASDHPVTCVSWYDAIAYCNWKSAIDQRRPVYQWQGKTDPAKWPAGWNLGTADGFDDGLSADMSANGYRLPTEAEWEYACRGGPGAPDQAYSGSDNPDEVGWSKLNAGFGTRPVGLLKPNKLGLLDMSGNVGEWCQDWYGAYGSDPAIDPSGPSTGVFRDLRGGGWYSGYWYFLRNAYRSSSPPDYCCTIFGFRLASRG